MVEEVGLRSTRIRTPKDTIISTPNGKLAEMTINNLGLKVYRIFRMEVNFGFDCSIEKIEEM
ncbi:MAG: mechanosensitive ion channel [Bacteroidetes bacterium]|nr:mechanosensitive ion channel [Bacteroidota bacterium]